MEIKMRIFKKTTTKATVRSQQRGKDSRRVGKRSIQFVIHTRSNYIDDNNAVNVRSNGCFKMTEWPQHGVNMFPLGSVIRFVFFKVPFAMESTILIIAINYSTCLGDST